MMEINFGRLLAAGAAAGVIAALLFACALFAFTGWYIGDKGC